MAQKSIRIIVIGDSGVGKTTIVTGMVSDSFQENVADVLPPVFIPAEATPAKVTTEIVDTKNKTNNSIPSISEIESSSAICLIFDLSKKESLERIFSFWIPELKKITKIIPLIIVGNKSDKVTKEEAILEMEERILKECPEVYFQKCSSKEKTEVEDVFLIAQNAVLFPSEILFDKKNQKLTIACEKAFTRIFYLSDLDVDDKLNDNELSLFQKICFGRDFENKDLEGIKNVIKNSFPYGIGNEDINIVGF